ncbi:MAG: PEP-CTERM sorting domain-containing protein [Planctomycetota bacterium]
MRLISRFQIPFVLILMLLIGKQTNAGVIVVSGDANLGIGHLNLGNFYHNLFDGDDLFAAPSTGFFVGSTANIMIREANSFARGNVSAAALAGKDWFVGGGDGNYSASQISAIVDFFNSGGNVFLIGDGGPTFGAQNQVVNNLLAALGSVIRIDNVNAASRSWQSTGASIGVDAFTAGIDKFGGNFAGSVTGGTSLFKANDTGLAVIAVERASSAAVPEPSSLALFSVFCAVSVRRRWRGSRTS